MIVKALIENTGVSDDIITEHGLSLYIETKKHKILFDTGRSGQFIENAIKMGVDIDSVNSVFISHGHYDHGGGLPRLLDTNKTATVRIHEKAFGDYYSMRPSGTVYIGLDKGIQDNRRILLTKDLEIIDNELSVYSGVSGEEPLSKSNKLLMMKKDGELVPDTFEHEQNLIVEEKGKAVLIAGCAHNGIVNIVEHFYRLKGYYPYAVIGGFHLYSPSTGEYERPEYIRIIAEKLIKSGSRYFTCHCTGLNAYAQLRTIMGRQIEYLSAGSVIEL